MSKANPRPDEDATESAAGASSTAESTTSSSETNTHAAGATGSAAAAGTDIPEEELRKTLEERYDELEARYDEIRDILEAYNRSAMDFIREHPGMCIAGAVGAGYIVGRLAARRWLV